MSQRRSAAAVVAPFLRRVWAGIPDRKSRLHTHKGNFVDLPALAYIPHSIVSTIWAKTTGNRRVTPWLGYRVVRRLDSLIKPEWNILEFGSGMSTIWFASRCEKIVSVESFLSWYESIQEKLRERNISNVDYLYREGEAYYGLNEYPDGYFDLVVVDGVNRIECTHAALNKVRPGGYILLDNSDYPAEEFRGSERVLMEACRARGGTAEYFSDMYPYLIGACESILVRF